jgi:hypothetical protein
MTPGHAVNRCAGFAAVLLRLWRWCFQMGAARRTAWTSDAACSPAPVPSTASVPPCTHPCSTFDPEEADFFYMPLYVTCWIHPVFGHADFPLYHGPLRECPPGRDSYVHAAQALATRG